MRPSGIKIGKRNQIVLAALIFVIATEIGIFFVVGKEFDRHEQLQITYPNLRGRTDEEIDAELISYIEHYDKMDDFPETEDGIHNLKKPFIYVWAVEPSTLDSLTTDPGCELYQKLRRYYPELERFENGGNVGVADIVDTIIDRKPSKLRFILLKIDDALYRASRTATLKTPSPSPISKRRM